MRVRDRDDVAVRKRRLARPRINGRQREHHRQIATSRSADVIEATVAARRRHLKGEGESSPKITPRMFSLSNLADQIDDALPQTQCTRCGYAGCRPYAEAIADGVADINRCPPGGQATLDTLARLLGRDPPPLDLSRGTPGPLHVALIDESACIGCTLCIKACPVDAIIGAPKRMHAILTSVCTGCELCIAPCPVDCIDLAPAGREWTRTDALRARRRFAAHQERLAEASSREAATVHARKRKATVDAAIARARARRAARMPT